MRGLSESGDLWLSPLWDRDSGKQLFSCSVTGQLRKKCKLNGVPADLLARTVSHLRTVNLASAVYRLQTVNLARTHCIKAQEASNSSNTLVNVNLHGVNRIGVPPVLLARAVFHLQTVNLAHTSLTTDQCVKVLESSITSNTLGSINLQAVNLSGVPAEWNGSFLLSNCQPGRQLS